MVPNPATGNIIAVDIKGDMRIDRAHVDLELVEHAGIYAWYVQLKSDAETQYEQAQYQEHCAKEDITVQLRKKDEAAGKKPKETDLKQRVNRHSKMREAYEHRMRAQQTVKELDGYLKALDSRGRLLQSLAGNLRTEKANSKFST